MGSEPDVESGWFGPVLQLRLDVSLDWSWALWGEVVLIDPGHQRLGEECVVAAGVVEVVGGVDEGGGTWGVSVGPVGPGVEGVESLLSLVEPVVVAVELSVDFEVVLEPIALGAELLSLVEEGLGAAGDFVKCGLRDGYVVRVLGGGVSCGSAVEAS